MGSEKIREATRDFAQAIGAASPAAGQKAVGLKANDDLITLWWEHQQLTKQSTAQTFEPSEKGIPTSGSLVTVDVTAEGDGAQILPSLIALGMQNATAFGKIVSGQLPIDRIDDLAKVQGVHSAAPSYATTNVGAVTSQGDAAMNADDARTAFGVDGSGVIVGVMSDSFDTGPGSYAADIASGDLPAGVNVLLDFAGGSDEGRAMAQLIHDVAPGAGLAYHTAFGGKASFAQGIIDLANAGAKVIVDDVFNLAEPMFLDGTIAQAVNSVAAQGVAYFSSAGNQSTKSYEAPYRAAPTSAFPYPLPFAYQSLHDFDPGAGTDVTQRFTLDNNRTIWMSFQWADPFFSDTGVGAKSDLDILVYDVAGNLLAGSAFDNVGGDPYEIFAFTNTSGATQSYDLVIGNYAGPNPTHIKYVDFRSANFTEHRTNSGASFGHASAEGGEGVGAADYRNTPAFGVNPPVLETFSSLSGTPILFDTSGNRLARPLYPDRVDITAPDGTDNTFFGSSDPDGTGFPNFFGTSAAAPHAAAVAALMLDYNNGLSPTQIYNALEQTAVDMNNPYTPGFDIGLDAATGYGLIDALAALGSLGTQTISIAAANASRAEGTDPDLSAPFTTRNFSFTVSRTGDRSEAVTLDYAVTGSGANPADANDFFQNVLPAGKVTIPAGLLSTTLNVRVLQDVFAELDEGFTVTLANQSAGAIGTGSANGLIRNDDTGPLPPLALTDPDLLIA